MRDTAKEYRDILFILDEQSKSDTKHNKLLKIQLITEDYNLKELLTEVIYGYKRYVSRGCWQDGVYPCNRQEWHEYMVPVKKKLTAYCNCVLESRKPQWKIIAEQNGWGPIC